MKITRSIYSSSVFANERFYCSFPLYHYPLPFVLNFKANHSRIYSVTEYHPNTLFSDYFSFILAILVIIFMALDDPSEKNNR